MSSLGTMYSERIWWKTLVYLYRTTKYTAMLYYLRAMQANAWVDMGTLHPKALFGDPESEEPRKRTYVRMH